MPTSKDFNVVHLIEQNLYQKCFSCKSETYKLYIYLMFIPIAQSWKILVNQIKLSCVEMDAGFMEVRKTMACVPFVTKTQFRRKTVLEKLRPVSLVENLWMLNACIFNLFRNNVNKFLT